MSSSPERFENYTNDRLFVEIGFGWDPAYLGAKDNEIRKEYFRDTHYIGVDLKPFEVKRSKVATSLNETDHMLSIGLNYGKLTDLKLPLQSIDELYLANVIAESHGAQELFDSSYHAMHLKEEFNKMTDPSLRTQIIRRLFPSINDPYRPLSSLLYSLEQAKEFLNQNCQLTIVETNTPTDIEVTKILLEDLDFKIEKIINWGDRSEWENMENIYHIQDGWVVDQAPYIIIAHLA